MLGAHELDNNHCCCAYDLALKLGSLRLANMLKREPKQQQAQQQQTPADAPSPALDSPQPEQQQSSNSEVVARLKATAAG
jgi:hypothetical protein